MTNSYSRGTPARGPNQTTFIFEGTCIDAMMPTSCFSTCITEAVETGTGRRSSNRAKCQVARALSDQATNFAELVVQTLRVW